jgi:RecB family endonuclease NucS
VEKKMPIWKITDKGPSKLPETSIKREKLLEENLEDWIVTDPTILGEPLLVIGRQVLIQDTKDKLDLLAVDTQGNSVVIELKRGHLKDPVDMQALRYASYISKWRFADFENQARNFTGKVGDPEFNFNAFFESFL